MATNRTKPGTRGLKLLYDLMDVVESEMKRTRPDSTPRELSESAVTAIAKYFGGRMAYIPTGEKLTRALRDMEIWETHNRNPTRDTVLDLAQEHGLTEIRVYQILSAQRELFIQRYRSRNDEEGRADRANNPAL